MSCWFFYHIVNTLCRVVLVAQRNNERAAHFPHAISHDDHQVLGWCGLLVKVHVCVHTSASRIILEGQQLAYVADHTNISYLTISSFICTQEYFPSKHSSCKTIHVRVCIFVCTCIYTGTKVACAYMGCLCIHGCMLQVHVHVWGVRQVAVRHTDVNECEAGVFIWYF